MVPACNYMDSGGEPCLTAAEFFILNETGVNRGSGNTLLVYLPACALHADGYETIPLLGPRNIVSGKLDP